MPIGTENKKNASTKDLHNSWTEIKLDQNEPSFRFPCELAFSTPDEEDMAARDIDDDGGRQSKQMRFAWRGGGGDESCVSPVREKEVRTEVFNTSKKVKF